MLYAFWLPISMCYYIYTYIYKVINSDYPSTNLLKFTNKPMHFQPRPRRTPPSAKVLIKKFCGGLTHFLILLAWKIFVNGSYFE